MALLVEIQTYGHPGSHTPDIITETPAKQFVTEVQSDYVTLVNGFLFRGIGSPEGVVIAEPGAIYSSSSGGIGVSLWVKETGSGYTGWVAYTA